MIPLFRSSSLNSFGKNSSISCKFREYPKSFISRGMKVDKRASDTSNHPKPWNIYPLLQSTTLNSVVDSHRPLVSFREEEKVGNAIKKLADNHVLAGMIFEMRGRPTGFLDILDIMTDLTHSANVNDPTRSIQEKIEILKSVGPKFTDQECETLRNASKRDPFVVVPATKSIYAAVQELTKVHRIAVADTNRWGVFAQLDVANFIMKRHNVLGTPMHTTVKESGVPMSAVVGAVDEHVSVAGAMRYMRDEKLSGVAVLDKHRKILTNFSATDLLGLTEDKFPFLLLPVGEYLAKMKGHHTPPITCRIDDTFETMLYKMTYNEVHRIYVVDEHFKPTSVITLTNIMQFLSKITD